MMAAESNGLIEQEGYYMESIELISRNLRLSEEIVLSKIDDMRPHGSVRPTLNGGCHTLWILGHLAFIESLVINEFMLGRENPLQDWKPLFDGEQVTDECLTAVTFDEALSACRTQRGRTVQLLSQMSEEQLNAVSAACPEKCEALFGTYRRCFQYVADHWYMHRGQLANARMAAGVGKMWY